MIPRYTFGPLSRSVALILLAPALLAACASRTTTAVSGKGPEVQVGPTTTVPGPPSPPAVFIAGSKLVGVPGVGAANLSGNPAGGLMGWQSPVGVPSADGSTVAYSAWTELVSVESGVSWSHQGVEPGDPVAMPSIRLFNLGTGEDTIFEEGAYSVAWRADGVIAYVKGIELYYRADMPYLGQILVRSAIDGQPEVWVSDLDRFVVLGWAGSKLLAYRQIEAEGGEGVDLLVIEGPGDMTILAKSSELVAISPDASQLLLYDAAARDAVLLDVVSGAELARLDLEEAFDPTSGAALRYAAYGGSWAGDRVVAETSTGIVLFKVSGASLTIEKTIPFPHELFPMEVHEPQFVDETGSTFVAWAPVFADQAAGTGRVYVYVSCVVETMVCTVGPAQSTDVFYQVYNPSRMEAG